MAVTASAGNATASIDPARPSWADMEANYPGREIDTQTLYTKIGGELARYWNLPGYGNSCAIRMSYALNRSGLKLKRRPGNDGSTIGTDKYVYWVRVQDLKAELIRRFKGADKRITFPPFPTTAINDEQVWNTKFDERVAAARKFIEEISSKKGIIMFDVTGWGDAYGHFTLWNGSTLAYARDHDDEREPSYYFWLSLIAEDEKTKKKFLIQISNISFWELK